MKLLRSVFLFAFLNLPWVYGSLFTSVRRMESALRKQLPIFTGYLDAYITEEERRIDELKCLLKDTKTLQRDLLNAVETTKGDPLTYFKFASFFSNNWYRVEDGLNTKKSRYLEDGIRTMRLNLPTHEDRDALIDGIGRIHTTLNLSISDLADGRILDKKSVTLSATECYDIAKRMYNKYLPRIALLWIDAGTSKLHGSYRSQSSGLEEQNSEEQTMGKLLELKQQAEEMYQKDWKSLNRTVREAMRFGKMNGVTSNRLNDTLEIKQILDEGKITYVGEEILRNLNQFKSYEQLCQGIIPAYTEDRAKIMRCFFAPHHHPFFKLRRVKVEVMTKSPLIMVLHDVVYDNEIDVMKEMVLETLTRSSVRMGFGANITDNRISESAYINATTWISLKLDERFRTLLGLNFSSFVTERYKVSDYGPAGVFEMHVDYLKNKQEIKGVFKSRSNRLFSLLTYMSNVEYGGRTAFPLIGISIEPIKGSMLIFENILPDGTGDMRTLHGSCPVVFGSKWISAKYVHNFGQNETTIRRIADNIV